MNVYNIAWLSPSRLQISSGAKFLLIILLSLENEESAEFSYEDLHTLLGVSDVRTIRRYLKDLVGAGYVKLETGSGRSVSKCYFIQNRFDTIQ